MLRSKNHRLLDDAAYTSARALLDAIRFLGRQPWMAAGEAAHCCWALSAESRDPSVVGWIAPVGTFPGKALSGVLGDLLRSRAPAWWWAGPAGTPWHLRCVLKMLGFRRSQVMQAMHCGLERSEYPRDAVPSGFREVEDFSVFLEWPHPCFGPRSEDGLVLPLKGRALLAAIRPQRLWHFAVFDGVVPIASATLLVDGAVAGIYDVAVSPGARRRGTAKAMLSTLLSVAKEKGCEYATVQSLPTVAGLYEALHFRTAGAFDVWWRAADASCRPEGTAGNVCSRDVCPSAAGRCEP